VGDVEEALSEGYDLLEPLAPLLAVPATVSLLNVAELRATLDHRGTYVGLEFPLPTPVADLWTFVNTPQDGGFAVSTPGFAGDAFSLSTAVVVAVGYLLLYAFLAAGYVGSIQQYRVRGAYDFFRNAGRYTLRYVVLTAVVFGSFLLVLPFVVALPPLFLLAGLAFLLVGYLFWGAWFLVVVADVGAVQALGWSYGLATTKHDYVVWSLVHVAVGGALSLVATWLAVDASVLGVLVALVVAVPAGFVLTVGSLQTIEDLVRSQGELPTDGDPDTASALGPG